jgi:hypothetical protein
LLRVHAIGGAETVAHDQNDRRLMLVRLNSIPVAKDGEGQQCESQHGE